MSELFNYLETAQNGNLNIAEITILTGVYRAGFHSPNVTALTVAAVPRHDELPPPAEVGGGGGGLGGGLHGEVVQVQVQLAVGHTPLTTNCLRHQPHLSWHVRIVLFQLSEQNVAESHFLLHSYQRWVKYLAALDLALAGRGDTGCLRWMWR